MGGELTGRSEERWELQTLLMDIHVKNATLLHWREIKGCNSSNYFYLLISQLKNIKSIDLWWANSQKDCFLVMVLFMGTVSKKEDVWSSAVKNLYICTSLKRLLSRQSRLCSYNFNKPFLFFFCWISKGVKTHVCISVDTRVLRGFYR